MSGAVSLYVEAGRTAATELPKVVPLGTDDSLVVVEVLLLVPLVPLLLPLTDFVPRPFWLALLLLLPLPLPLPLLLFLLVFLVLLLPPFLLDPGPVAHGLLLLGFFAAHTAAWQPRLVFVGELVQRQAGKGPTLTR